MSYSKFYPARIYKWHVTPLYRLKEMLESRRANQYDSIILVTGDRGIGKTTFTGKICFLFEDFSPWESMVYTKEKMFERIKLKNGIIWADESVVNAARGNVMTRANKLLFEATTINRDNYNIIFFLMPSIEDFDTKILQYCSMWIHIDTRGMGVLLLPANRGLFGKKNWDVNYLKKLYDEFMKENKTANHVPYWIFNNFRGYIKFGKLTDEQDKIIKEVKMLRKNENMDKETQQEVTVEVKELVNYKKYASMKIAEKVIKGEIRDIEVFKLQCTDLKIEFEEALKKCDNILKRNGIPKSTKGLLKEYEKQDALLKF